MGGFSWQPKDEVSDFILPGWTCWDAQISVAASVSACRPDGRVASFDLFPALSEFKNLFVSPVIRLGLTHNSCALIMGVIIGQELLCKRACLILWGLAWLADINCMEAIKLEGNVMWAEFKHTDLWHFIFFFFKLTQRRAEREKEKRKDQESEGKHTEKRENESFWVLGENSKVQSQYYASAIALSMNSLKKYK